MTEKEQIRAEIERRLQRENEIFWNAKKRGTYPSPSCEYNLLTLTSLRDFIDSLPDEKPSEDLEEAIKPDFAGCVLDSTKVALLGKTAGKSLLEPHIETMRRQIERKIAELPPAPEGYRYAWKVENYIKEEDAFTVTSNIVLKPIDPEKE